MHGGKSLIVIGLVPALASCGSQSSKPYQGVFAITTAQGFSNTGTSAVSDSKLFSGYIYESATIPETSVSESPTDTLFEKKDKACTYTITRPSTVTDANIATETTETVSPVTLDIGSLQLTTQRSSAPVNAAANSSAVSDGDTLLHSYSVTFNDDLTANEEVQIAFPSFKLESAITPGTLLNLKAPPSLRFANFAPADTTNWIAILTATVESLLDVGEDTASVTISATSAEGVQTHAVTCTLNKKITTLSELMNIDYINVTFDGISSIELHFTAAHAATNLSTGDLGITVSSTATAQYLLNIQ